MNASVQFERTNERMKRFNNKPEGAQKSAYIRHGLGREMGCMREMADVISRRTHKFLCKYGMLDNLLCTTVCSVL